MEKASDKITRRPVTNESDHEPAELLRKLKPFIRKCASIHHDLNNPLAGVLGYTEFILSDPDNLTDELKKDLAQIDKCANKMKGIIEDVAIAKGQLLDEIGPEALEEFLKSD